MPFLIKNYRRFIFAVRGIIFAIRNDYSFRIQWYGGLTILAGISYFLQPLSHYEFLWIALGYALILITELQNSSFEMALDRLHPELHESIGASKDMAAGAVLVAGLFLALVLVTLTLIRIV